MKEIVIYTDGACSGNPGPGGWAAVLRYGGHKKEISGYMPGTTNNRMEIMAALYGITALKEPCRITVCSDSAYLVNAFEKGWLDTWRLNGWKNAAKQPVENQDLWMALLLAIKKSGHEVRFVKVAGHAGDEDNNRCDALAKAAIRQGLKDQEADLPEELEEDEEALGES